MWGRGRPERRLSLLISVVFLLGSLTTFILYRPNLITELRVIFRAGGDMQTILKYRMPLWQAGFASVGHDPIFGKGPMSKFGDTDNPTVNEYDEKRTCGNTLLLYAQFYGIPGALLLVLLLIEIIRSGIRAMSSLGLLSCGVVFMGIGASFSQMWLVSFGSPGDRAVWLILGVALARNEYTWHKSAEDNRCL